MATARLKCILLQYTNANYTIIGITNIAVLTAYILGISWQWGAYKWVAGGRVYHSPGGGAAAGLKDALNTASAEVGQYKKAKELWERRLWLRGEGGEGG